MTTQEQYIERLKELVTKEIGHPITNVEDCIALSDTIFDKTGIRVSVNSLEQLYCMSHSLAPRPATISALARYLGYGSWSDFCTSRDIKPSEDTDKIPVTRRWGVILLTAAAIIFVIVTAIMLLGDDGEEPEPIQDIVAENVENRFNPIKDEWLAATTEHCNTLREYYKPEMIELYVAYVESVNSEYIKQIHDKIFDDIARFAAEHNITVDNATIKRTAEETAAACEQLCNNIIDEARTQIVAE